MIRKNNRGFTVVELVVSIALLAIIFVPVAGFFTDSFKVQKKSSLKSSITRVGQYVMENFKNKEYLELDVEVSGNDYGILSSDKLEGVIQKVGNKHGVENICSYVKRVYGELEYNNFKYDVEIKLNEVTESDVSNLDMPDRLSCTGEIVIDDEEDCTSKDSTIDFYNKNEEFINPIDGKTYTANYNTIIVNASFVSGLNASETATLWLENHYYDFYNSKQGTFRIIKNFDNELTVYIEGENVSIVKGQEGDGAPASKTRVTKLYVGEEAEEDLNEGSSHVLFDANMVISRKDDESVRDTFDFSFPVNYEF